MPSPPSASWKATGRQPSVPSARWRSATALWGAAPADGADQQINTTRDVLAQKQHQSCARARQKDGMSQVPPGLCRDDLEIRCMDEGWFKCFIFYLYFVVFFPRISPLLVFSGSVSFPLSLFLSQSLSLLLAVRLTISKNPDILLEQGRAGTRKCCVFRPYSKASSCVNTPSSFFTKRALCSPRQSKTQTPVSTRAQACSSTS